MKKKIENSIGDFVSICYTYFKIGAGDFAKENFYKLVENCWDNNKSEGENLSEIKSMFKLNANLNKINGNSEASKTIQAFIDGWLNKIE